MKLNVYSVSSRTGLMTIELRYLHKSEDRPGEAGEQWYRFDVTFNKVSQHVALSRSELQQLGSHIAELLEETKDETTK